MSEEGEKAIGKREAGQRGSGAADTLTAVPGVRVGHWTDTEAWTGCTAILFDEGAVGAVDVRGGGPGTRETDALAPGRLVEHVHGVLLTGGSAFGLAAADGVMRYLAENNVGYDTGVARVPIVPAAVIFDLAIGDGRRRPGADAGYAAASSSSGDAVVQGNVGAGTGATAGKWAGPQFAVKSGLGSSALPLPGGGTVGAIVAANPIGDIVDPLTGRIVAGAYDRDNRTFVTVPAGGAGGAGTASGRDGGATQAPNTVVALVATDVALSKEAVHRVALMAHDGIARTVYPAHTPWDGDTVFAVSTWQHASAAANRQEEMERVGVIGAAAAEALAMAIVAAAKAARPAAGFPAASSLPGATDS